MSPIWITGSSLGTAPMRVVWEPIRVGTSVSWTWVIE